MTLFWLDVYKMFSYAILKKKKEKEEEVNILLALEDKLHNLKVFCSLRRAFSAIHHDRVFINE